MSLSHQLARQLKDAPAVAVTALDRGRIGAKYLVACCRATVRLAHLASRCARVANPSHTTSQSCYEETIPTDMHRSRQLFYVRPKRKKKKSLKKKS